MGLSFIPLLISNQNFNGDFTIVRYIGVSSKTPPTPIYVRAANSPESPVGAWPPSAPGPRRRLAPVGAWPPSAPGPRRRLAPVSAWPPESARSPPFSSTSPAPRSPDVPAPHP